MRFVSDTERAHAPAVRPVRGVARWFAVAWSLLAVSALGSGAPEDALWATIVVGSVAFLLGVATFARARRVLVVSVGVYAHALVIATLAASVGVIDGLGGTRVELFAPNANLLGAGLAASFAAWSVVAPGRRWVWWGWPLLALAVLLTGSRTALLASAVAFGSWTVAAFVRGRGVRGVALATALVVAGVGAVYGWQRYVVEPMVNLVPAPNDFGHPSWSVADGAEVTVIPDATPGPFDGTRAQRVTARPAEGEHRLFWFGMKRLSVADPYVASVYARADEPQPIVLSNGRERIVCDVASEWRRCETPAAVGPGRSQMMHDLRVPEPGVGIDVYLYGAQLERSEEATALVDTHPTWLPPPLLYRLDLRHFDLIDDARRDALASALTVWRASPWFGVGMDAAYDVMAHLHPTGARHAHNQLAQAFLEWGVVGVVGWLVLAGGVARRLGWRGVRALAPLLLALVVLNIWDATLFERTGFYAALSAIAVAVGRKAAFDPGIDKDGAS